MIVNPSFGTKSVNIKRATVSANGTSNNKVALVVPGLAQENVVVGLFGDGKRNGVSSVALCGAMQHQNVVDTCLVAGVTGAGATTWSVSHRGSVIELSSNFSTGAFVIDAGLYVEAIVQFI